MVPNIQLRVTHIEVGGPQGPFIKFWGLELHGYTSMRNVMSNIENVLESTPPLKELKLSKLCEQVCFVYVSNQWQRATILSMKQSLRGTLEVFCIDSGALELICSSHLKILDGKSTTVVHQCPPLASKFVLADIIGPLSERDYSLKAIAILGAKLKGRTWTAIPVGFVDGCQAVRLFGSDFTLFASTLIEQGLGFPSPSYEEALAMSRFLNGQLPGFPMEPLLFTQRNPQQSSLFNPVTITEIPVVNLADEEKLLVVFSDKPGSFFGKLAKIPVKDFDKMATELFVVYSSISNPPLLYTDDTCRLGHFGVLEWTNAQDKYRFCRVLVIAELLNETVKVHFIDYGNILWIPRSKVLAPLDRLIHFRQPPHGIHCKLEGNVSLSASEWNNLIMDKLIKVKIGKCVEEMYSVTIINDQLAEVPPTIRRTTANSVSASVLPKFSTIVSKNEQKRDAPPTVGLVSAEQAVYARANVSSVKSLKEFYIQLSPASVDFIKKRIREIVLDPAFRNQMEFSATVGRLCLAIYPADGLWRRGVIEAVEKDWVKVRYIDYGNCCDLQLSHLKEYPPDSNIVNVPALAFECGLEDIISNEDHNKIVLKSARFGEKICKFDDGVLYFQCSYDYNTQLLRRYIKSVDRNKLRQVLENPQNAPPNIQKVFLETIESYIAKKLRQLTAWRYQFKL